jgi:hypothetical protein
MVLSSRKQSNENRFDGDDNPESHGFVALAQISMAALSSVRFAFNSSIRP